MVGFDPWQVPVVDFVLCHLFNTCLQEFHSGVSEFDFHVYL